MPMLITANAPVCEDSVSVASPMKKGKTVPPKSPIIISPDASFFLSGLCSKLERRENV